MINLPLLIWPIQRVRLDQQKVRDMPRRIGVLRLGGFN
jgi:hypothetical protein